MSGGGEDRCNLHRECGVQRRKVSGEGEDRCNLHTECGVKEERYREGVRIGVTCVEHDAFTRRVLCRIQFGCKIQTLLRTKGLVLVSKMQVTGKKSRQGTVMNSRWE